MLLIKLNFLSRIKDNFKYKHKLGKKSKIFFRLRFSKKIKIENLLRLLVKDYNTYNK